MNRRDRAVVLGALALLAVLAASLVGGPAGAVPLDAASPAGKAQSLAGVLREGVIGRVTTLDPLFAVQPVEQDLDALLFRGLTRLGPDGTVLPDLAAGWTISDDGRTYTFELGGDGRWADGVPVTMDDVLFTIKTLQDPAYDGPLGAAWSGVAVDAPDPTTVRFTLTAPAAGFLVAAAQPIMPSHLLRAVPVKDLAGSGFGAAPVGSGPFSLAHLDAAGAELLRSVADGGGGPSEEPIDAPSEAAPAVPTAAPPSRADALDEPITTIRVRFFDEADALAAAFRSGELDAVGGLPPAVAAGLNALDGVRQVRYRRATLTAAVLNVRVDHPAFRDARVRRALLAAVDRAGIRDELLDGAATVTDVPISPFSPLYAAPAVAPVPFDPQAAADGLTAAGWKRGPDGWTAPGVAGTVGFEVATVDQGTNPITYAVAERLVGAWQALGLHARLEVFSVEKLVAERLMPHSFDVAVVDLNVGLDVNLAPLLLSAQARKAGTNLAGFQSPQLDALLRAAANAPDGTRRQAAFTDLERSLSSLMPLLPICFADRVELVRERVQGVMPRELGAPSDRFWDVLTWRLAGTP